ncbi:MAG: hypothetical protein II886_00230 [Prevotella sp.]|nr:hypothetical protein [Prevotella sp.]
MKKEDYLEFMKGVENRVKEAVVEDLQMGESLIPLKFRVDLNYILDGSVEVRIVDNFGCLKTSNLFSFLSRLGVTPETTMDNDCITWGAEGQESVLIICIASEHFFED